VRILSVRAHDIAIGAPSEHAPPLPAHAPVRPTPHVAPMARGASAGVQSPAQAPAERPSSEALEDLYDAVRNRQITDTQVIREIAGHFAALARAPRAAGEPLPFDPAAAAQLLSEYADSLDAVRPAQRARRR
jgi:hypothetical protein